MKLSIILPIYNEERSISELFERIVEVLSELHYTYETVVINDGSRLLGRGISYLPVRDMGYRSN